MIARAAAGASPAAEASISRHLSSVEHVFEYVGNSGMTATGGVTRRRYIFFTPGSRVVVDPRDAASLRAIPLLRQV